MKQNIKNFTIEQLKGEMAKIGEPPYRATQVFYWIYKSGVSDFDSMNNISKSLKGTLKEKYYISKLELFEDLKSRDGTEKFLFKLTDGNFIETVLIQAEDRKTLCLSTQVGCKFHCAFCASGRRKFVRNLEPSEIVDQMLFLRHNRRHKITNCVFMGMGEPLDNYENVSKVLRIMNNPSGMNMGARRITISTCGIIPGIRKIKDLGMQINLSISLNAANNKLRNELMPINKRYPLEELIEACEDYISKTGRLITLEYVLIKNINDSRGAADELQAIARRLKAKVNLIAYSPVLHLKFQPPSEKDIDTFMKVLAKHKVKVTLRQSKGKDIGAACGQLAGKAKGEI